MSVSKHIQEHAQIGTPDFSNIIYTVRPGQDIQNIIDNAISGSLVVVGAGEHIVSRVNPGTIDYCIHIDKSLEFRLSPGAVIKLADGELTQPTLDNVRIIQIDSSDVYITGFGTVDMNFAGQIDTSIGGNISNRVGIDMRGEYNNVTICDVEVKDAFGDGIYLSGSPSSTTRATNLRVINTRLNGCREGILLHWADNVAFLNNRLIMRNDTGAQDGIETSGCNNIQINNNYVENAKGSGYDIFEQAKKCTLNGNQAIDCGNGIALGYNIVATTGLHSGGNGEASLTTTGLSPGAHVGEIIRNTTDGSEGLVTANTATTVTAILTGGTDNLWDTNDSYEIQAMGDEVSIVGNTVSGGTLNNFHGIWIYALGGATRTIIMANTVKNLTATGQHGIAVSEGYDVLIANNIIRDVLGTNGRGILIFIDAHDILVQNNIISATTSHGIENRGDDCMIQNNKMANENLENSGTNTVITGNSILSISGVAVGQEYHGNYTGGVWTP